MHGVRHSNYPRSYLFCSNSVARLSFLTGNSAIYPWISRCYISCPSWKSCQQIEWWQDAYFISADCYVLIRTQLVISRSSHLLVHSMRRSCICYFNYMQENCSTIAEWNTVSKDLCPSTFFACSSFSTTVQPFRLCVCGNF